MTYWLFPFFVTLTIMFYMLPIKVKEIGNYEYDEMLSK